MKTFLQYIEEKSVLGLIEFFNIDGIGKCAILMRAELGRGSPLPRVGAVVCLAKEQQQEGVRGGPVYLELREPNPHTVCRAVVLVLPSRSARECVSVVRKDRRSLLFVVCMVDLCHQSCSVQEQGVGGAQDCELNPNPV